MSPRPLVYQRNRGHPKAAKDAGLRRHAAPMRYLRLSRNFGKEAALSAGLAHAKGNVIVLMDADLQHPPALIGTMLDVWARGADMVLCT